MWANIIQFVSSHWQAIGGFALYVLVALIATMPVPGQPFHAYTWLYEWTHALINSPGAAKFRPSAPPVIPNDQPSKGAVTK